VINLPDLEIGEDVGLTAGRVVTSAVPELPGCKVMKSCICPRVWDSQRFLGNSMNPGFYVVVKSSPMSALYSPVI
jgi:hypothetical protein